MRPKMHGIIDAGFALRLQAALGLRHERRKHRQQYVAVVRFAEGILEPGQTFGASVQRRLALLEALERVAKPLTSDAKIVKAPLIAQVEADREPARFAQARLQDSACNLDGAVCAAQIDALRFQVLTGESRAAQAAVRAPRCLGLAFA